jgi:hypothetical protein
MIQRFPNLNGFPLIGRKGPCRLKRGVENP